VTMNECERRFLVNFDNLKEQLIKNPFP